MSSGDAAGLWLAVVASGLYHGANPGMGWPLAVSAALMERSRRALAGPLLALAAGHFLAMAVVLLPFAAASALVERQREIRIGAACLVIGYGLWLFVRNRHPRVLARIPPTQLLLWSLLSATAHGAGLMLLPVYLGMPGHAHGGVGTALQVAIVHTAAMTAAGGTLAYAVHRWLGLEFIRRSWFDLDRVWAGSLVVVGVVSLVVAVG